MRSTHRAFWSQTKQGKHTRTLIISWFIQHPEQEVSRDDLIRDCHLTYEQVRRQTKNLCIEGQIQSWCDRNGKRLYRLL